ncbi:hypothetical protein [Clostridium baratii]|uniref:hypothetical protein n=1 Tax=Clostridium baratii TaxID=1561 RepID=UPI002942EF44|nr:hypothetical protein [Clostridium baratii]
MNTIYNLYKKYQSYIIVLFLTISITSLVIKGSSDSSFVENFNFASTITSIILSVIAIFLTLVDSEKNSIVINNITDAAKNVEESTNTLNDAKATIEEFISKFNETEKNILNGTKEHISKGMKEAVMDMVKESAITLNCRKAPFFRCGDERQGINYNKNIFNYDIINILKLNI